MSVKQSTSKSMTTYFYGDRPDGVRKCKLRSSTITAFIVPRELLGEAKRLNNNLTYGIYYLLGKRNSSAKPEMYVGQTTLGFARMDDHKAHKDFWDVAILFLASRENFTLEILNGLEKYAIQAAGSLNRYTCTNGKNPQYLATDDEQADVEDFYEEICFYMAAFGYPLTDEGLETVDSGEVVYAVEAFDADDTAQAPQEPSVADGLESFSDSEAPAPDSKAADQGNEECPDEVRCHACHPKRGVKAEAIFYPADLTMDVLEGSLIDFSLEPAFKRCQSKRQDLLESGNLERKEDGLYILKTSVPCSSSSEAAAFVFGSSRSGPREWNDEDGTPLKERFSELFPD